MTTPPIYFSTWDSVPVDDDVLPFSALNPSLENRIANCLLVRRFDHHVPCKEPPTTTGVFAGIRNRTYVNRQRHRLPATASVLYLGRFPYLGLKLCHQFFGETLAAQGYSDLGSVSVVPRVRRQPVLAADDH